LPPREMKQQKGLGTLVFGQQEKHDLMKKAAEGGGNSKIYKKKVRVRFDGDRGTKRRSVCKGGLPGRGVSGGAIDEKKNNQRVKVKIRTRGEAARKFPGPSGKKRNSGKSEKKKVAHS